MDPRGNIGHEINVLARMIRRNIDSRNCSDGNDVLTGRHGWLIGYMYKNRDKEIFQKDIERVFNIRRSTVTGIIKLMEKNGLVKRESVKSDKRLKKLVLTQKAVEIHSFFEKKIEDLESILKKGLTEEEIFEFNRTINKLKANLTTEGNEGIK